MKPWLLFLILLLFVNSALFAQAPQDSLPEMNKAVLNYVNSVMGKKVDRGECWDLANKALIVTGGKWDHHFAYGKLINPDKEEVFPGDLIQFYGVKTKYTTNAGEFSETMKQHTAIVYKVLGKGDYEIAHQNLERNGKVIKKINVTPFNLKHVVKGKLKIYRPVKDN